MPLRNFFTGKGGATASIFLHAHALRDPLTAIRWGVGTLRKAKDDSLNADDRRHMLDEIYTETRTLATLLESMMLMAEIEQGAYTRQPKEIALKPFLQQLLESFEQAREAQWRLECGDERVEADEKILRAVLQSVLTVRSDSLKTPVNMLVKTHETNGAVCLDFFISLVFPVLHSEETTPLLAGSPALLLSLAHSLASTIGGEIAIEKKVGGNFVPLGERDGEEDRSPANHFKISLCLPASVKPHTAKEQDLALAA